MSLGNSGINRVQGPIRAKAEDDVRKFASGRMRVWRITRPDGSVFYEIGNAHDLSEDSGESVAFVYLNQSDLRDLEKLLTDEREARA